jgi:hypothetical protein
MPSRNPDRVQHLRPTGHRFAPLDGYGRRHPNATSRLRVSWRRLVGHGLLRTAYKLAI